MGLGHRARFQFPVDGGPTGQPEQESAPVPLANASAPQQVDRPRATTQTLRLCQAAFFLTSVDAALRIALQSALFPSESAEFKSKQVADPSPVFEARNRLRELQVELDVVGEQVARALSVERGGKGTKTNDKRLEKLFHVRIPQILEQVMQELVRLRDHNRGILDDLIAEATPERLEGWQHALEGEDTVTDSGDAALQELKADREALFDQLRIFENFRDAVTTQAACTRGILSRVSLGNWLLDLLRGDGLPDCLLESDLAVGLHRRTAEVALLGGLHAIKALASHACDHTFSARHLAGMKEFDLSTGSGAHGGGVLRAAAEFNTQPSFHYREQGVSPKIAASFEARLKVAPAFVTRLCELLELRSAEFEALDALAREAGTNCQIDFDAKTSEIVFSMGFVEAAGNLMKSSKKFILPPPVLDLDEEDAEIESHATGPKGINPCCELVIQMPSSPGNVPLNVNVPAGMFLQRVGANGFNALRAYAQQLCSRDPDITHFRVVPSGASPSVQPQIFKRGDYNIELVGSPELRPAYRYSDAEHPLTKTLPGEREDRESRALMQQFWYRTPAASLHSRYVLSDAHAFGDPQLQAAFSQLCRFASPIHFHLLPRYHEGIDYSVGLGELRAMVTGLASAAEQIKAATKAKRLFLVEHPCESPHPRLANLRRTVDFYDGRGALCGRVWVYQFDLTERKPARLIAEPLTAKDIEAARSRLFDLMEQLEDVVFFDRERFKAELQKAKIFVGQAFLDAVILGAQDLSPEQARGIDQVAMRWPAFWRDPLISVKFEADGTLKIHHRADADPESRISGVVA